jgi:hypothetical protein
MRPETSSAAVKQVAFELGFNPNARSSAFCMSLVITAAERLWSVAFANSRARSWLLTLIIDATGPKLSPLYCGKYIVFLDLQRRFGPEDACYAYCQRTKWRLSLYVDRYNELEQS